MFVRQISVVKCRDISGALITPEIGSKKRRKEDTVVKDRQQAFICCAALAKSLVIKAPFFCIIHH